MAKYYGWPPSYWRTMGLVEFNAWREATHRYAESEGSGTTVDTWGDSRSDPRWQAMREKHRQRLGKG